jgi:glycosyltransferase domain-containing protein
MSVHEELTILLTLKDRVPFTARWMSYADKTRFPFKVLIADGGTDDGAKELLSDKSKFPNVNYEYVRYTPDLGYPDYYAKIADALGRVRTPYVAMADNDDFFFADALREAVRFLAEHPDYVACGGQGAIFWVLSPSFSGEDCLLYGESVEWKSSLETKSMDSGSARERILAQATSTIDTFFYDVKTIGEARKQFEIVRDLELRDLFLTEHLIRFLSAIAGKSKRLDQLYLARQHNAPETSSGIHSEMFGDWFGRMLVRTWSEDFSRFLDAVSTSLAKTDGIPREEARVCVVQAYRMLVAPQLMSNLFDEPTATLSMATIVPIVRRIVAMPETNILKRIARMLYRRMSWISVDSVYGTELVATPVGNSRQTIQPVLKFLSRK